MKHMPYTLDQLALFCKEQRLLKFNAIDYGYPLSVQIPTTFKVEEDVDEDHRGMLKLKIRIFHTGLNRNNSFVSKKAADNAAPTVKDRPVLAHIHQLDDGTWDFESHNMEIVEGENGQSEIQYIEKQVGSFTSSEPFWEHDDELDKDYLCAYAYISEEYTKAADIIREKGWTKNSCELDIEEMSFNTKENYLCLDKFYLSGSTLLGSLADGTPIGEGMLGSRADIASFTIEDFNRENNSAFTNYEVIAMLGEINRKIDQLTINNRGKEENQMEFEEKAEVTEILTDEVETVAEEFTEADNSEEIIEESATEESTEEEVAVTEAESEDTEEVTPPDENFEVDETEKIEEESVEEKTEEVETDQSNLQMAVTVAGETKNFALSLNQKILDLTTLVNEVYGENDNTYYSCDVFEDGQKYVIMHDFWNDRHYKQEFSYSNKKSAYTLKGDRTSVFAQYLTDVEIQQLENMRANYSVIETELAQYEAEPDKIAVLESEDYANLAGNEAFEALKSQEKHFDLSVDELKSQCDSMLLEYAKGHKVEFEAKEDVTEKKTVGFKRVIPESPNKKTGKYGGIFSRKSE